MRPPGFPGNPPARMPRAPTPARSPPPRPLRGGDVAFRPTQDVGPRDQCISGLNHAGLRTPCERFAPWVTPGPRITRFRLAADLGRMGLDTHRVSNKVSKITSRHLVPLDRAFPAHALVHDSSRAHTMPPDRILTCRCDMTLVGRGRSSDSGSHSRGRPHSPASWTPGAKVIADDGLVAEERVLHPALTMVP